MRRPVVIRATKGCGRQQGLYLTDRDRGGEREDDPRDRAPTGDGGGSSLAPRRPRRVPERRRRDLGRFPMIEVEQTAEPFLPCDATVRVRRGGGTRGSARSRGRAPCLTFGGRNDRDDFLYGRPTDVEDLSDLTNFSEFLDYLRKGKGDRPSPTAPLILSDDRIDLALPESPISESPESQDSRSVHLSGARSGRRTRRRR